MGRASSIAKLPDDVRQQLSAWLQDPCITQGETTERTNALLEAIGVDYRISRSAVNRYSQSMEEVGQRMRDSREVQKLWIDRIGSEPKGQLSKFINEIIVSLTFDTTIALSDGDEPVPPKVLKELALTIQRLESAANMNAERERKIRTDERNLALTEAADAVEERASEGGVSKATIQEIRNEILGLK